MSDTDETLTSEAEAAELRSKVLAIQRNSELSAAEKSRAIQDVMMAKWRVGNPEQESGRRAERDDRVATWHDEQAGVRGCAHYARRCKLFASCCEQYFTCRLCHDEEYNDTKHVLDRYAVEKVLCMECGAEGAPAAECGACGVRFARYSCLVCNLFDDTEGKDIYHCDKCGLCRRGQGLGVDYWHCDTCAMCLAIGMEDHVCIEHNLKSECPVCREYMFTSRDELSVLRCGHCMHKSCYYAYLESSVICPLCSKTLYDMTREWESMDEMLSFFSMPEEYAASVSHILCNDCETYSDVAYDFRAHKCTQCGGYNTRVISVTHPNHVTEARFAGAGDEDGGASGDDGDEDSGYEGFAAVNDEDGGDDPAVYVVDDGAELVPMTIAGGGPTLGDAGNDDDDSDSGGSDS